MNPFWITRTVSSPPCCQARRQSCHCCCLRHPLKSTRLKKKIHAVAREHLPQLQRMAKSSGMESSKKQPPVTTSRCGTQVLHWHACFGSAVATLLHMLRCPTLLHLQKSTWPAWTLEQEDPWKQPDLVLNGAAIPKNGVSAPEAGKPTKTEQRLNEPQVSTTYAKLNELSPIRKDKNS